MAMLPTKGSAAERERDQDKETGEREEQVMFQIDAVLHAILPIQVFLL